MNLNNLTVCLKDLIWAKKCPLCACFDCENKLCFSCFSQLKILPIGCAKCQNPLLFFNDEIQICEKCIDKDLTFYDEMICALIYNPFLKDCLVRLKNQELFYLSDLFCSFLYSKIKKKLKANSVIVPVPLFEQKLFKRGYNQSWLLSKSLSKITGIPAVSDVLLRVRNTNTQANKTSKERFLNVKNAFKVNERYRNFIKNKEILIIDDVITTGATIFESAKAFMDFGVGNVKLLAIGRRLLITY